MKQVSVIISTYTADVSGVCSALYELGGMVVIHDPSGCNSTYNTHDEPRWYEQDSLVFISGLSEIDAIMGNDEKFVEDIIRAAKELTPRFIALVRTPVPMMIGTDFDALCLLIEERTGIPAFYFPTNGMHSYVQGVEMALETAAKRLVDAKACSESQENGTPPELNGQQKIPINILGVTPLDFSINETLSSMIDFFESHGCFVISTFAMESTPKQIAMAGEAAVNVVVSSAGLLAAKVLEERFQIPYVVGMPTEGFGEALMADIKEAVKTGISRISYGKRETSRNCHKKEQEISRDGYDYEKKQVTSRNYYKKEQETPMYLIGEAVISQSLRAAIALKYGREVQVICPLETREELLREGCILLQSEEEIREKLKEAEAVIADPMYRPICPENVRFFDLPHEAFSGRIYRKQIPDLTNLTFLKGWIESLPFEREM